LVAVCRQKLAADPLAGALFVFSNRRRQALKLLVYDGQGFWLCQKRLSKGRFHWWPTVHHGATRHLAAHQLQTLLWNGNPDKDTASPDWRRLPVMA